MPRYSAAHTLVSPLADADRPWRASLVGASAEVQQHDQHSRSRDVPKGRKLLTGVASPKGPFALEESLGPASARAPPRSAPDFRAARQHLQDVHPARLTNAFAKVDLQRKGQLGLSDFASVLRRLGVPATAAPMLKGGSWDASSDSIDYEAFVASLAPGASECGPAVADTAGAADTAARGAVRSIRHGPVTTRRHYGAHHTPERPQKPSGHPLKICLATVRLLVLPRQPPSFHARPVAIIASIPLTAARQHTHQLKDMPRVHSVVVMLPIHSVLRT